MWALRALLIGLGVAQMGCGGLYYTVTIRSAEARVEEARAAGAEASAPYEYYYAKEHLREAQLQAARASYGDAATFAETAETYAQKAIDRTTGAKHTESPQ